MKVDGLAVRETEQATSRKIREKMGEMCNISLKKKRRKRWTWEPEVKGKGSLDLLHETLPPHK